MQYLQTYFALCDSPQRFDHAHLGLCAWRIINELHHHLDHLRDGLLELTMLLAQQLYLLIEQTPVAAVFAYCHDGDQQSRC